MSPQRRLLAGSVAFCWGAGASTWLQATLRWLVLTPETGSLPSLGATAVLVLGLGAGAAWARALPHRFDTPLAILVATTTSLLLATLGAVAPVLATLGAGGLGFAMVQHRHHPAALLIGAGFGSVVVAAGAPALLGISGTRILAVALLLPALARRGDGSGGASAQEDQRVHATLAGGLVATWAVVAAWILEPITGQTESAHAITFAVLAVGLGTGICLPSWKAVPPLLALAGGLVLTIAYPTFDTWGPGIARALGGIETRPATLVFNTTTSGLLILPWSAFCGTLLRERADSASGLAAAIVGAALSLSALTLLLQSPVPAPWDTPFEQRYGPLLEHRVGVRGAVLVTDDPEQGRILRRGSGRLAGAVGSDVSDRVAAQIPMLLHPRPQRVLLLDFAVGNEASTLLAHPIERLDALDPSGAAHLVAPLFDESNLDVLSDDRLALHATEPWSYLDRATASAWDVILWQVTGVEENSGYRVPTHERIELIRARLSPGGLFALRLGVGSISANEVRDVVATVAATFESLSLWQEPSGLHWILVAGQHAHPLEERHLLALLGDPDVEAELGALELDSTAEVLALAVGGEDLANELAQRGRILTRDRTRLDDRVPGLPDSYFGLGVIAADSSLGPLSDPERREGIGLVRLFARLAEMRELVSASDRPETSAGERGRPPPPGDERRGTR